MEKVNTHKTPVYRDTGFCFENAGQTSKAFEVEKEYPGQHEQYIYSRYRNPTVASAEKRISHLEGAGWAVLTQSGMSSIDVALSLYQDRNSRRNWLFFSDIYGGTNSYIDEILIQKRGIPLHRFPPEGDRYNLDDLEQQLTMLNPVLLYFEVVSNPMLIIADLERIIPLAKKYDCAVIIDNTFATPHLVRPLTLGADLVIHSVTKYLSGHGTLTAGAVCGNDPGLMKQAIDYRKWVGHMISPDDAARLEDQLKTFQIRFEKQLTNAQYLAGILDGHPMVDRVMFPGLGHHPTHAIAKRIFQGKGYGAMITFDLKGRDENEKRRHRDVFIEKVSERIALIPTLGDVETTILPIEAVWGEKYPLPGMIRLSVGIEDVDQLEHTLKGAL